MTSANDLMNRINERYATLSKGQKRIAAYITDNYDEAVFFTAARLGEVVGVSESTVVRFATHLGYKGYPQFQQAMAEMVRGKLDAVQQMEYVYGKITRSEILTTVLKSDAKRIEDTLKMIDEHAFDLAVDAILHARHIYVIGIRSCAPLAEFLVFYLSALFTACIEGDGICQ